MVSHMGSTVTKETIMKILIFAAVLALGLSAASAWAIVCTTYTIGGITTTYCN